MGKLWCPVCGDTFGWAKRYEPTGARARATRRWLEHAWACYAASGGRWLPRGTSRPWGGGAAWGTTWQAKRVALIRDSVPGDDVENPWQRHPVCQACGAVSEGTVSRALHGAARGFEVQHILPRSQRGSNDPRNLAVLCRPCHVRTFRNGYRGVPMAGVDVVPRPGVVRLDAFAAADK
jgi:5-methylcytosine-specific restriction endonuclease McrA